VSTFGERIGKLVDEALDDRAEVERWAGYRSCAQLMFFIAETALEWATHVTHKREMAAIKARGVLLRYAPEVVDSGARVDDVAALIARMRGKKIIHPAYKDRTTN
jgi:hypothetical protein